jgi:hypothetical protein
MERGAKSEVRFFCGIVAMTGGVDPDEGDALDVTRETYF